MTANIYILNLETTTKNCSVSLSCNGKLLEISERNDGNYSHAEFLNVFIDDVLSKAKITIDKIDAVAVSQGPGSYTGLRIGVSAAKGLCYALNIPLIALDTMTLIAKQLTIADGLIISVLDARRMEVYQAVYDSSYTCKEAVKSCIVTSDTYNEYFQLGKVHFIGNATEKIKTVINNSQAVFYKESFPSSKEMAAMSYHKYLSKDFKDVAYFEPFYLKAFQAGKKKQ